MVPPPMGRIRGTFLAALVAAAAIAGCGGGSDSASENTADLTSPLGVSCDPAGFQHSAPARHYEGSNPSGWQITYRAKIGR